MKIKKNSPKIVKPCTDCFKPRYLKFNFSYLKNCDIPENHKVKMFERMIELSSCTFVSLGNKDKKIGYEMIDKKELGYDRQFPQEMTERFSLDVKKPKIAIVRLYPNDNPVLARIIGLIINQIFYILEIDIGGKSYKHS